MTMSFRTNDRGCRFDEDKVDRYGQMGPEDQHLDLCPSIPCYSTRVPLGRTRSALPLFYCRHRAESGALQRRRW
jgi:hypothetical protein